MPFDDDPFTTLTADTTRFRLELTEMERLSRGVGRALSSAFEGAAVRGRGLGDVMRTLSLRLTDIALKAALRPAEAALSGLLQNAVGGLVGAVTPFAKGGVVSSPTYFPMAGGTGLAGEAGAEAILPLARGPDGRLGVRAGGGGASITVNISTPDAESFRRSEAQVTAALARAVARGRRGL